VRRRKYNMNTDKTIKDKFVDISDKPIWYYKELNPVSIDYVIFYLLKEHFVVDINGSKHEITFGKNRKGEIGQCIRYDDITNSNLCSYEVIQKGFREGTWFIITDIDTSNEFKNDYDKRKELHTKESTKEMYKSMLKSAISEIKDLSEMQKEKHIKELENSSYEELEKLINVLMKNIK
jgi:hypothetical protein